MLAGEVSSTRKKQEFVMRSNGGTYQSFAYKVKGSITVDWGDGTKDYFYSNNDTTSRTFTHTYTSAYSGDIKLRGNVNLIKYLVFGTGTNTTATQSQILKLSSIDYLYVYGPSDDWTLNINNLPSRVSTFSIAGVNKIYGTVSSTTKFPDTLTSLSINGNNTIAGDIKWFFGTTASIIMPNLTSLGIGGKNTLSGNLINILRGNPSLVGPTGPNGEPYWFTQIEDTQSYTNLTSLTIDGNNTVTGDIKWLAWTNLSAYGYLHIQGNNTIYGDIGIFKVFSRVTIYGNNTVSGNLIGLSTDIGYAPYAFDNIKYLAIQGYNTISGDIKDLPVSMTAISLWGYNTVYGDIANLPTSLDGFTIHGRNTITGDIANISCGSLTSFYLDGYGDGAYGPVVGYGNTIYGDIADLATVGDLANTLSIFSVGGHNTLTGDISSLASFNNLSSFFINGNSSIYGDIGNIPDMLNRFLLANSSGYIYGDISNNSLQTFYVTGTNSITGNIANININMYSFTLYKNTTKLSYTSKTWPVNQIKNLYLSPNIGAGLTTTEVDNLLIDLANGGAANGATIYLAGHNSPHSAVSNVAIGILISKSCILSYNI
jgi:hypothetical protein